MSKGVSVLHTPVYRIAMGALALFGYVTVMQLPLDLSDAQRHVVGVVIVAAVLWFSEALPLFVTSLLIPVLLAFGADLSSKQLFTPFFDPVIALFFGSFVLAAALSKYGLDQRAAALAFRIFGHSPRRLLLSLMLVVAFIGAWLSNTATVAFMLPIFLLLIRKNKLATRAPNLMKSLLLGLAIATSIDGMATIIGTPPNAIAVKFLADAGIVIDFFDWMKFGIPLVLVLLPLAWLVLILVFPPEIKQLTPLKLKHTPWSRQELGTLAIIAAVLALWVTQPLHGIDAAIIALAGSVALFATKLLESSDLSRVPFATLLTFGGGLVLGEAMVHTGVTDVVATQLFGSLGTQPQSIILLALLGFAVIATAFVSNTAMASILIPIIVSFAQTAHLDVAPLVIGVTLALSVDVISPVGTPPSVMVYGSGHLRVSDFVRSGVLITAIGVGAIFVAVRFLVG